MSFISTILVIFTFLLGIVDWISKKPFHERKGVFKHIRYNNIGLFLLGWLLLFQLVDLVNTNQKEKRLENVANETYESAMYTLEKIEIVDSLLNKGLYSLKHEILNTQDKFNEISELNDKIDLIKNEVERSLNEYQDLNNRYSERLRIEKERILSLKPDVRCFMPINIIDSTSISYQFRLVNYGNRLADSVIYNSIMVLFDESLAIKEVSLLKTNKTNHNILILPPNQQNQQVVNSFILRKTEKRIFKEGILLVSGSYYDGLTQKRIDIPLNTFYCSSFNDESHNRQYANNISSSRISDIEKYLKKFNPGFHEKFFSKN